MQHRHPIGLLLGRRQTGWTTAPCYNSVSSWNAHQSWNATFYFLFHSCANLIKMLFGHYFTYESAEKVQNSADMSFCWLYQKRATFSGPPCDFSNMTPIPVTGVVEVNPEIRFVNQNVQQSANPKITSTQIFEHLIKTALGFDNAAKNAAFDAVHILFYITFPTVTS